MSKMGCYNCVNCEWNESDRIYFCSKEKQVDEEVFDSVWLCEEDWERDEQPLCSEFKEGGGIE